MSGIIDNEGMRANVAIVLLNPQGYCWLGQRMMASEPAWQFPQGGLHPGEDVETAMWRELAEETGLGPQHATLIGQSTEPIPYIIPEHLTRDSRRPIRGQKQTWFLLKTRTDSPPFNLRTTGQPEFVDGHWVSYWYPLSRIVDFKREAYRQGLASLLPVALLHGV